MLLLVTDHALSRGKIQSTRKSACLQVIRAGLTEASVKKRIDRAMMGSGRMAKAKTKRQEEERAAEMFNFSQPKRRDSFPVTPLISALGSRNETGG